MHSSQGHYISMIYRHLQIHLNSRFEVFGFGSGQYLFFNHIALNEGVSQKELSSLLAIDKATTAKAVNKLVLLGYIHRERDSGDRRYNRLFLTDAGRTILPQVREILLSTRNILQEGMNKDEIEQSLRLLDTMLGNILALNGRRRHGCDR